ncbi:hypothetical protein BDR03DRAFT_986700 [Suillus americanus]|nr:hypothetical protein BDR03DRAFT_986700 [Suillus americanus]
MNEIVFTMLGRLNLRSYTMKISCNDGPRRSRTKAWYVDSLPNQKTRGIPTPPLSEAQMTSQYMDFVASTGTYNCTCTRVSTPSTDFFCPSFNLSSPALQIARISQSTSVIYCLNLFVEWAELEHDSLKVDAFVRCINWKLVTFANHIINLTVYTDATKGFEEEKLQLLFCQQEPIAERERRTDTTNGWEGQFYGITESLMRRGDLINGEPRMDGPGEESADGLNVTNDDEEGEGMMLTAGIARMSRAMRDKIGNVVSCCCKDYKEPPRDMVKAAIRADFNGKTGTDVGNGSAGCFYNSAIVFEQDVSTTAKIPSGP